MKDKIINVIKNETDLCNTFCCYENCEKCVEDYINHKQRLERIDQFFDGLSIEKFDEILIRNGMRE